ncbi:MAG: peptidylprolyl isomerase [Ruminococcaceae bacterium]|nr:peptidylprolyl isomerase [Oscillospiraceae bacterium]
MPNYDDVKEIEVVDTERKNVKVTMADGQSFTICVYPDVAPQTAQNFLNLVRDGFYDGLTFHRIIDGFMAQGGDPEGTGMGGSDTNIIGEFSQNGFENSLSHKRGVVSMARSNHPNSASSQFFICYDDASFLDGQYAAFGEVVSGMEVVDSFLESGTDENDRPLEEVKIATVVVEE